MDVEMGKRDKKNSSTNHEAPSSSELWAKAVESLSKEDTPFSKSLFSFEFGIYLSLVFVAYFFLCKVMYNVSDSLQHRLSLTPSWLGPMDLEDYQWSSFRKLLPTVSIVALVHVLCNFLLKRVCSGSESRAALCRAWLELAFGFALTVFLHQSQSALLLILLTIMYSGVKACLVLLPLRSSKHRLWAAQAFSWTFALLVLFQAHLRPTLFFVSHWLGSEYRKYDIQLHSWTMTWNMVLLRSISFTMDWAWMTNGTVARPLSSDHLTTCLVCRRGGSCLTSRIRTHQPAEHYSLLFFLSYVLYIPLYVAGPIITYNSFVSQLHSWQESHSSRAQITYVLRWLGCLLLMELMARFFYVWALRDGDIYKGVLNTSQLCVVAYWSLVALWLKFTVIWRFFRAWSLLVGIEPPENMTRCMNNNYTMQSFWRGWHASFNSWLVRYLYIPLGGSRYKLLNLWVVFIFVALWHEIQPRLLYWALFVCLLFLPELSLGMLHRSAWLRQSSFWSDWRESFSYRLLCAIFASASIMLMMSVNLIGFFVGLSGVSRLLHALVFESESRTFLIICFVSLSAASMLMFKIRVNERIQRQMMKIEGKRTSQ